MRTCERCKRPDRPILEADKSCRKCPPEANEDPLSHADGCPKVMHEVRPLYKLAKLIHTSLHPEGQLEPKWLREGWKLKQDGKQFFRWKMLCRACIEVEYERETLQRDYKKACLAARGQEDKTYNQLILEQAQ